MEENDNGLTDSFQPKQFTLESERLILVPMTARQLRLWVEDLSALEKELHCTYDAESLTGVFLKIVKSQLAITEKDEANYIYHSFCLLIRREDGIVVGSADFKDLPDANGEVEIGYGLGSKYEHHGYMTEAVRTMCRWGMEQDGITHIIAGTDKENTASQNILIRCGFQKYRQDEIIWWRL